VRRADWPWQCRHLADYWRSGTARFISSVGAPEQDFGCRDELCGLQLVAELDRE
jgi:hypothetical protein